jgi:cell division septation protein DedD
MNSLLDDEDDPPSDRELTLSTGTILGIFFGLVLLCGLFFGFGYKMGSHKPAQPVLAIAPETPAPSTTAFDSFKPAAGFPAGAPPAAPVHTPAPGHADDTTTPEAPSPATHPSTPAHIIQPTADPTPAPAPAGAFVVQVAAFTHPEDADLLVHALKVKGYPAFARSEPQDKLQHIQVGPFTNRKDAEAAKQRLLTDGYQPILK